MFLILLCEFNFFYQQNILLKSNKIQNSISIFDPSAMLQGRVWTGLGGGHEGLKQVFQEPEYVELARVSMLHWPLSG